MRGDYDDPEVKEEKPHVPLVQRARDLLIGLVWHPHEREESQKAREDADAE